MVRCHIGNGLRPRLNTFEEIAHMIPGRQSLAEFPNPLVQILIILFG